MWKKRCQRKKSKRKKLLEIEKSKGKLSQLFVCPNTLEPIKNPVMTADRHIFEKEYIEEWIAKYKTCPITRKPLELKDLKSADFILEIDTFAELKQELSKRV